jgi:hypothetical protein
MEFLLITFPSERKVLIDGVHAGLTNQLITLAPGTYLVSLGPPKNFAPTERLVVVEGTSPLDPLEIAFG